MKERVGGAQRPLEKVELGEVALVPREQQLRVVGLLRGRGREEAPPPLGRLCCQELVGTQIRLHRRKEHITLTFV